MSDCIGPINIIPDNNQVVLVDVNKTITIIDNNCCTTVDITQPVTSVVQILTGPIGATGEFPTSGSLNLTGSINVSGSITANEIYSPYFSGSFYGNGSGVFSGSFTGSFSANLQDITNNGNVTTLPITASSFYGNGLQIVGDTTITGSLTISGSNTFRNIGPTQLTGSTGISGSLGINGVDYEFTSASFDYRILNLSSSVGILSGSYLNSSASFDTRILNNSSSISLLSGSYLNSSGSFSTRVTNLENFSSSLDTIFATDAELNAATASLSSSIAYLSGSYLIASASFSSSIASLTSATSSYVLNSQTSSMTVLSASYAQTASYAANVPATASYALQALSSSYSQTSSYVLNAVSSSFATTASYVQNAQTASYILNAISSSFSSTASYLNTLNQNLIFNGNLTLNGTASITYLNVVYESSSIIYSSGSNQLGDATNDVQTLIGRTIVSGSFEVTGSTNIPSLTGSLLGTASYADYSLSSSNALTASYVQNAQTASYVLNAVSSSFSQTASYVENAQTASFVLNAVSASYSLSSSQAQNANTASYVTLAQTASYVENAQTASYVLNAVSSSFASTASYYLETDPIFVAKSASLATTGSNIFIGNQTITGSVIMSGSIQSVNWIDFITTDGYPHQEGRIHWTDDTKTLQLDTDVNNFNIEVGHQSVVRVRNVTGDILTKGKVVYIDGESGNRPTVVTASYVDEEQSFNVIGVIAQDISNAQTGYVITDGLIRGINTTIYSPGTILFLSSSGDYTSNIPTSPLHQIIIGKTITQATDGIIYIKIRPGYAIDDLHDVIDSSTTSSYGDLLVKSGSVWINSKQLTGSYGLTGSLTATSFTGSLLGTASFALTASYSLNAGTTIDTGSFVTTSSFNTFTGSYNTGSFTGSFTGSLHGTASWAENSLTASFIQNAQSASYVLNAVSSSYASTASYVENAQSASYVLQAVSSSYVLSSSYSEHASTATSASYAPNTGVTQIIAGSNILISPVNGIGNVTISSISSGGGNSGSNFVASFSSESVWNVNHNLGNRYVVIQAYDSDHNEVIPENIQLTSTSSSTITFPTSESGYAVVSLGGALSSSYASFAEISSTASYAVFANEALSSSYSSTAITASFALRVANPNYIIVSASYNMLNTDEVIEVIQGNTTQSLPTAVGIQGKQYSVINVSTGSILLQASGAEKIGNKNTGNSGSLTIFMGDAPRIVSNNLNWRII